MSDIKWGRVGIALVTLVGFFPFALFLTRDHLFDFLNAIAISIGLGVLVAYVPGLFKWFTAPRTLAQHLLIIGIVCTWLGTADRLTASWWWRYLGQPPGILDHIVVAFGVYLFVIGGALHLVAHGAIKGEVPLKSWTWAGVLVALGSVLGFVVIEWLDAPN